MIYPPVDLKYRITIDREGFKIDKDPWQVYIRDTFGRELATITPDVTYRDSEGRWYFSLEQVPTGRYIAKTTTKAPDDNFESGYMTITDKQKLVEVGLYGCEEVCRCSHTTDGLTVTFERVYTRYIADVEYLADKDGNLIWTSDGKLITFIKKYEEDMEVPTVKLNMTGDEFKKLIEGNDPNGSINTIPELLHAMDGIDDTTTVKQEIKDETDETYDEETETMYLDGERPEEEEG